MFKWYKLIKWIKKQRKTGQYSFSVITNKDEFIIYIHQTNEELRIKY
jgi:hypothetical protein